MTKKILLSLLLFCCCSPLSGILTAKETVDYVVVGVGTAGATIAKLLTDNNNISVVALHSGKNLNEDPDVKLTENVMFTVASSLFGSSSLFKTGDSIPQASANNRELLWAMGFPLGGASAINAGAWAKGTDEVYVQWENIAGPEWSLTIISDIYKNLENYVGQTPNTIARGYGGPLVVRQNPAPTALMEKFAQAVSIGTGVPIIVDYNNPLTPIGAAPQTQFTQLGNQGQFRESSANTFLNSKVMTASGEGVGNRKLKVKYNSTALRTIWSGNKAIGVEYYHNNKIKKVYANKGVIVCAGLYSSSFLMHSGVGPADILTPLGIPVKYHNQNVGQGLADQVLFITAFSANPSDTPTGTTCSGTIPSSISIKMLNLFSFLSPGEQQELIQAILCSEFAFPGNSIFGQLANLPDPNGVDPNLRKIRLTTTNPIPGVAFALFDLVQPKSRGRITINSSNPFAPPVIDNRIFSDPDDLELYTDAFQTYLKNINHAFQTVVDPQYALIYPPLELLDHRERLKNFIRESAASNQCWQGHCRMAPLGQGGVVDGTGKVHGVENLYVADDSIVPVAMDGTPMATAYLIACNIARMLLQ